MTKGSESYKIAWVGLPEALEVLKCLKTSWRCHPIAPQCVTDGFVVATIDKSRAGRFLLIPTQRPARVSHNK